MVRVGCDDFEGEGMGCSSTLVAERVDGPVMVPCLASGSYSDGPSSRPISPKQLFALITIVPRDSYEKRYFSC